MIVTNKDFDLEKIMNSGQCFRMYKDSKTEYHIIAFDKVLHLTQLENGVEIHCSENDFENIWESYFDLDTNYEKIRNSIDSKDDFLKKAAEYGKGIRILKQDKWEMLISFIISQRKNIPAIQSSIEKICKLFGNKIIDNGNIYYSFPSPRQLSKATMEQLNSCSLGYRTPYIIETANSIYNGTFVLNNLDNLSYDEIILELEKLKGVGVKVANCVALFSYHKLDSFPIDVWIKRVLEEQYNNNFPIDRYKGYEGVIQQYMFFYARTK